MPAATHASDVFGRVNELPPESVQRLADRMETRRLDPTFSAWREAYLDRLGLDGADTVLEVGCGTGAVARAIAGRAGFTGTVVAADYSEAFVAAGARLAAEEGLAGRIDFRVLDSHALDLPDGAVSTAVAHTVFSHLADPLRALAELARVTRPGGTVVVFDGDYASLAFGSRDQQAGAAIEAALVATIARHPTVLRTLPRLATAVGLEVVDVTAHVLAEVGTAGFFGNFLETYAPMAADAGLVPTPQLSAWLEEQQRAARSGGFFAACNYYTYLLGRP
jgi:ubiquinone/menaquinone biosynthesis C-methylase UbiE